MMCEQRDLANSTLPLFVILLWVFLSGGDGVKLLFTNVIRWNIQTMLCVSEKCYASIVTYKLSQTLIKNMTSLQPDPEYLDHFGELATLKNCLGCTFNQDWTCDFSSAEEAFLSVANGAAEPERSRLIEQIQLVLSWSDAELQSFVERYTDVFFDSEQAKRPWLLQFLNHLEAGRRV